MKKLLSIIAVSIVSMGIAWSQAPIIGISSYVDGGTCEVNMTYVNSVRLAGGVPLVIPVTSDEKQIEAIISTIDGLVMTGGEDFDPMKWFGEEPLRALGEVVPSRDDFDVKLVRAAVAKGIPVLGICRGEQLFAAAFGGKMWQDIPSQVKTSTVKHRQGPTGSANATHSILIEKGSKLASILGSEKVVVNSFHHQAIKEAPAGMKIVARSADGIVEAVERDTVLKGYEDGKGWLLGVQFHPEALVNGGNMSFLPIFETLVKEASRKDR